MQNLKKLVYLDILLPNPAGMNNIANDPFPEIFKVTYQPDISSSFVSIS